METLLRDHGIPPTAQRVAIAEYALHTTDHPSADQVWVRVRGGLPVLSRATVYNTLHLFVRKGLLRQLVLAEGRVVFDPQTAPHHHLVDEQTGVIHDVPWGAIEVRNVHALAGYEVRDYQVVMRGRAVSGRAGR